MKTHHPKLKTQPRPFFSCGFFRHCTQTALSPTASHSPSLPLSSSSPPPPLPASNPPPPAPPPSLLSPQPLLRAPQPESSSSSSSSTSQSFTQWRFPLIASPLHQHSPNPLDTQPKGNTPLSPPPQTLPPPIHSAKLQELFHATELQLTSGSESDKLAALYLLERSLVPNPPSDPVCSPELMHGVVANLKNKAGAKPATKILLALCLAEGNRHVAVEAGAVGAVVEVAMELEGPAAERALAALELTCTVEEGAAELRAHALAVPVMVSMMGKMAGRGKEYALSALAVVYGGGAGGSEEQMNVQHAPPEEVARAVALALQDDCTPRARRKGTQLLKALQEYGRLDMTHDGNERI